MQYLDTSLLIAALTPIEEATSRAQAWIEQRAGNALFISDWVLTEVASALSVKLRTGQISLDERANISAVFQRYVAESLSTLEVERRHFHAAALFAGEHQLNIRSGDALHLAMAQYHGLTLCTLDRRLAEAGPPLGVSTLLI